MARYNPTINHILLINTMHILAYLLEQMRQSNASKAIPTHQQHNIITIVLVFDVALMAKNQAKVPLKLSNTHCKTNY
jgi:hypothetical protein